MSLLGRPVWIRSRSEHTTLTHRVEGSPDDEDTMDFGGAMYGRVDLIVEPDRGPTIMELELIEPNLFLRSNPGSATVLADAITAWAARNRHHERSRS